MLGSRTGRQLPVVDAGPYTPDVLDAIAQGERKVVAHALSESRTVASAIEAAASAARRNDELANAAIARRPPTPAIACRAGCPSCCVSKVIALAPEVIRIAEHLRSTSSDAAFADLVARVEAADSVTRGKSRAERARLGIPCPLLDRDSGSCSVHSVRPLVCAGWTSLDVHACERHFADPDATPTAPLYAPQYAIASALLGGVALGCADAGLDGSLLELIAALRIALTRANAGERWIRGLPVFSQAADAEAAHPGA